MRILLIEDDYYSQREFSAYIKELRPDAEIVGITDSISSSIELINNTENIDLIFSDIRLKDGYSFDIFQHVETNALIVFVTAYEGFALKAFDYECIDYLVKPVLKDNLKHAFQKYDKALLRTDKEKATAIWEELRKNNGDLHRLAIISGPDQIIIKEEDIAYLQFIKGYIHVLCKDGRHGVIRSSLLGLLEKLDENVFFQANRTEVININCIERISKDIMLKSFAKMNPSLHIEPIEIARDRVGILKKMLADTR